MMQRCSSSRSSSHRSDVVGHCPCGLFHAPGSSLCLLFGGGGDVGEGPFGSPSGVDCTLSLSTPSSRSTANARSSSRSGGRISNLRWDIFHPKQQPAAVGRGAGDGTGAGAVQVHHLGGEALLARRCANCDTTSTPLWRNGPRGPKSLCNACGIRYKKEERRASSTAADVGQLHHVPHAYPWAYAAAAQAAHKASPAEFRLIQGDDDGAPPAVPFLPWRLNTPGLLHDYT